MFRGYLVPSCPTQLSHLSPFVLHLAPVLFPSSSPWSLSSEHSFMFLDTVLNFVSPLVTSSLLYLGNLALLTELRIRPSTSCSKHRYSMNFFDHREQQVKHKCCADCKCLSNVFQEYWKLMISIRNANWRKVGHSLHESRRNPLNLISSG